MESEDIYNPTKLFLTLATAMMLACFSSKAYDVYNNYQSLSDKECLQKNSLNTNNDCYDEKIKAINEYTDNKTTSMLILGFVYLVAGVIVTKNSPSSSLIGISLGGFFLIAYYLATNWFKFSQKNQVMIMGAILVGMIFAGSNVDYKKFLN